MIIDENNYLIEVTDEDLEDGVFVVPNNVEGMGEDPFIKCQNLKTIIINDGYPVYSGIENYDSNYSKVDLVLPMNFLDELKEVDNYGISNTNIKFVDEICEIDLKKDDYNIKWSYKASEDVFNIYNYSSVLIKNEEKFIEKYRGTQDEELLRKCMKNNPEIFAEIINEDNFEIIIKDLKELDEKFLVSKLDKFTESFDKYIQSDIESKEFMVIPKVLFEKSLLNNPNWILEQSKLGNMKYLKMLQKQLASYRNNQNNGFSRRREDRRNQTSYGNEKKLETNSENGPLDKLLTMLQDDAQVGFEWQDECLNSISDKNNVILSSPTGSGKTKVFLKWATEKKERPIYITAPIKALSNQRYRELATAGYRVGIETGDIHNVPENCDFICLTQEIYTNKYMQQEDATCIMDEFHYIFENHDRARTYIDSLHKSKAKNMMICSATFGDMDKLEKYIEKVSNRQFYAYEGKQRSTKLNYHGEIMNNSSIWNSLLIAFSNVNCEEICKELSLVRDEMGYEIGDEKKAKVQKLSEKYKIKNKQLMDNVKHGVATYYGAMLRKEKLFVEELFENKIIDTVAGTDALAMGVNFPVENVVFTQVSKNEYNHISKNLFDQLAGRAGRKGYFDEGNVYYNNTLLKGDVNPSDYFELLLSENEPVSIKLGLDYKSILQAQSNGSFKEVVASECDYVEKFSTVKRNLEYEISMFVQSEKRYEEEIGKEHRNHYYWDDEEETEDVEEHPMHGFLRQEFHDNIGNVYFSQYDYETNFKLFSILLEKREALLGNHPEYEEVDDYKKNDNTIEEYYNNDNNPVVSLFCSLIDDGDTDKKIPMYGYYKMNQMMEYMKQMPNEYRKLMKINTLKNLMEELDDSVAIETSGTLSMDELRAGIGKVKKQENVLEGGER